MPRYAREPQPEGGNVAALTQWIDREFQKITEAMEQFVENPIPERTVEPTKKPNGLIVLADGTDWDPGSGRGLYWYDANAAAWKFLG